MQTLIVGYGEVGRAHFENLSREYPRTTFYKDVAPHIYDFCGRKARPEKVDLLLVALRCDPADMGGFYIAVDEYVKQFKPSIVDVLTTTPPGSCDELQAMMPATKVCRSSTRGMHPNLAKFLIDIPKHIGGPSAEILKLYYERAGWECIVHSKTRAVELFHVLNNFIYGVNIMAADEAAKYCRDYGVDYMEFLKYRESNNRGFVRAGHPSKVSPILYPSGGKIGGHCVTYSATTIPENQRGPLAKMLAGNDGR